MWMVSTKFWHRGKRTTRKWLINTVVAVLNIEFIQFYGSLEQKSWISDNKLFLLLIWQICRLESSLHVGNAHEHVIHTFLSTSAACLLPVIANSVQTYFMVMTSYNWWRFVLVTIISLVLNQTWIAVYMMVTYTTPSNACHAGLFVAILAGFSGGFIVTRDQMPIGWVSILFNAYTSMISLF